MLRSPPSFILALLCCVVLRSAGAQAPAVDSTASLEHAFTLGPGDVVQTAVWREPDLTGAFKVDELGRLTLPMIGVVSVTGKPWDLLRDSLLEEYARHLRNPSVTLTPLRHVQVLGEVYKPGPYLADPTLSLAGLVALAGGATPNGDLHRIRVIRDGRTIVNNASVESLLLQSGVHSNDQIFIDRAPWLERNGAIVASTMISAAGILITILHR